jgi:hypothetical protein
MSRPADGGGPAQPVDVTPADLQSVALAFGVGQERIDSLATTLNGSLQAAAGMAGDDKYGKGFAKDYDPSTKALFGTLSACVRAVGQAATCLTATANNYLKADHHSDARAGKGGPQLYTPPFVVTDVMYPDPPTAVGSGSNSWPPPLDKYWPDGHQDRLRAAAAAFRATATGLDDLARDLHARVQSVTENNSSASINAMSDFWGRIWIDCDAGGAAPLSTAQLACNQLAKACENFTQAIDQAHSEFESKLAEAGIAVGLTTALGVLGTVFTGGGSDAGAVALDAGEAAGIFASVETILDVALSDLAAEGIAALEAMLSTAAEGIPEIEMVEAETTEVGTALDNEMAQTEERELAGVGGRGGSGGGGGGDEPPPGFRGEEPSAPEPDPDDPNLGRLRPAERDTLGRAQQQYPDLGLKASAEERDGEYVDSQGRTYDQMGNPNTSKFWDRPGAPQKFYQAIQDHLSKSMDFTVLDLSGFSEQSAADIQAYVDSLSPAEQAKIIRIGF